MANPKTDTCAGCKGQLPDTRFECCLCGAVVCGGKAIAWECFVLHCGQVAGDEKHRDKPAKVRQIFV